jgi:two-component system chemotaxis response regulator CheB
MTIGQDEISSVVYGMPRVAFELGYIHRQVHLDDMARVITETTVALRTA